MINLSDFSECLKDLMTTKELDSPTLAKKINVHENSIYRYVAGTVLPTLDIALKLANFFECSIEYLFARTESKNAHANNLLPPFAERLRYIFNYFNSNEYRLTQATKISRSRTHGWLTGESIPGIENLAKIADYYNTTIDFIIGLEN